MTAVDVEGTRGPSLSVVVASCREPRLLDACLGSILPQANAHSAEVVVSRAGSTAEVAELAGRYTEVRFVEAPPDSSIPELRARGMAATTGDVIALTEDHCVVAADWLAQMQRAHQAGVDVVGGAMDNAQRTRAVDWGAYFAEYGFFAAGDLGADDLEAVDSAAVHRGAAGRWTDDPGAANLRPRTAEPRITGANVAYSRRVVDDVIRWARQGEWENVAHARLSARGSALQFLRTAAVYQNQNYRFGAFCRDRFEHGVGYARRRLVDEGSRRWLYLSGSVALPALLLARLSRTVHRDLRTPFLRALPLTGAFLVAWSLGEAVGYLRGPAPANDNDEQDA